MFRSALLICLFATLSPAWVESVEFPWNAYPHQLWERELAWLKNIGITHVSLPQGKDPERLKEVIQIVRRLDLEADLEGPVPDELQPLMRAHGGPLTEPLASGTPRIAATSTTSLTKARELLSSGSTSLIWTDVEDTLGPEGYRAGAVDFAGEETARTVPLRRDALLAAYWGKTFSTMSAVVGPAARIAPPPEGVTVKQFISETGASVITVQNTSSKPWTGDLKAVYAAAKKTIALPPVTVPARGSLWLPVNVPLMAGPLCKDCSAFATVDHLVYATAELTGMEYENGILAMEFSAPSDGEVVLQLSREPSGPLVAGGRPVAFDWDDKEMRARLKIPAGTAAGNRVRIGLAIEPPDATAFFDNARVLMIGETNHLPAQFSSEAIAQRSRLRTTPALAAEPSPGKDVTSLNYAITVPATAVHGDHAELAIEADGIQMSHARVQLLRPASLRFADAVNVHLSARSVLPLYPALIPVNQRTGREISISIRNNAPEIRTFHLALNAGGLEFSPANMDVVVGASTSREAHFRVFVKDAGAALHEGTAKLSGAAELTEQVAFAVLPAGDDLHYSEGEFRATENPRYRATFIGTRWLEFIDKDTDKNLLGDTGLPFKAGMENMSLEDLQKFVPRVDTKPKSEGLPVVH